MHTDWKEKVQLTCFHKRDQDSTRCKQDETKDLDVGHCLLQDESCLWECSNSLKWRSSFWRLNENFVLSSPFRCICTHRAANTLQSLIHTHRHWFRQTYLLKSRGGSSSLQVGLTLLHPSNLTVGPLQTDPLHPSKAHTLWQLAAKPKRRQGLCCVSNNRSTHLTSPCVKDSGE